MIQKPCRMTLRSRLRLSVAIIMEVSLLLFLSLVGTRAGAQITTVITHTTGAGDLGTQVLPPNNNVYGITGGKPVGDNLFHSFAQLDVGTGDIAQFQTTTLIPNEAMRNILGRITDTNPSIIFGTIDSATYYPGASLFLINPYGFLFGPNATVNVGGMVAFTTADYLKLADNVRFEAIPGAQDALLSAFPVATFGFLGSNPQAIAIQGSTLTLAAGTGLSLVGGDITIGADPETGTPATLMAPSGEIHLASVASPGEVLLPNLQTGPNINGQSFTTMGNVSLIEGAFLDASGSPTEGAGAGGTIRIRAGQFIMDNAVLYSATQGELDGAPAAVDINVTGDVSLNNFSAVASQGFGAGRSGDINISANNVLVESVSFVSTATDGDGLAGNIRITATDTLSVRGTDGEGNFSSIESVTNGSNRSVRAGDSGDITINAATVSLTDQGLIRTTTLADGNSGNITIAADSVNLTTEGSVQTRGEGQGATGSITVTATDTVSLLRGPQLPGSQQSTLGNVQRGTGSGGGISVSAKNFQLTDGAQIINQSNTASGPVTITASDSILIGGGSEINSQTFFGSIGPIQLSAAKSITLSDQAVLKGTTIGSGTGGTISLTAESISLSGQSFITSRTISSGQGGQIQLNASDSVSLSGGAIITTSSLNPATGSAGPINITAGNAVSLSGAGTKILSETAASGNGGAITIQTNQAQITDGAVISATSTGSGAAGSVTIEGNSPAQSVLIDGSGSGIFTDTQGTGAGGNISVDADSVTLQNGGMLSAATSGTNNGGDIQVNATTINLLSFASIFAMSSLDVSAGNPGNIALKATQQITAVDSFLSTDTVGGTGLGGNILLRAPTIVLNGGVLGASTTGTGQAGNVLLEGQQISLGASPFTVQQGVDLFASTSGSGHGGTVTIRGLDGPSSHADNVTISGFSRFHTGTFSDGDAGDITINAAQFTLTDHATLNADTFGSGEAGTITITATDHATVSGLLTTVSSISDFGATGNAGQISVSAPTVMLENGGSIFTNTTGEGTGGGINILASQSVTMTNGSSISASSTGPGNAGNILINAGQNFTATDSSVTTQADAASGGTIKITTNPSGTVQLTNSLISASVLDGTGGGGSVNIDPLYVLFQNSQMLAKAVQGPGGNITINITNGGLFLSDANSVISASSQFGVNGTVTIQSPNAPASGKIQPLGKTPLLPTSLLNQHCAALAGGEFSSFTVAGRDSLPTEPGSWLASPLYAAGMEPRLKAEGGRRGLKAEGVKAEGERPDIPILSLRQIAPAGFLTQAFAVDWSAGCQS